MDFKVACCKYKFNICIKRNNMQIYIKQKRRMFLYKVLCNL